jgi:hypothetical protein
MQPTVSGYTSSSTSLGSSPFVVDPSSNVVTGSVSTGDWIIIVFTSASGLANSKIPSPPSGWTNLVPFESVGSGTMSFGVWAHQKGAGETTYTWTQTTSQTNGTFSAMTFVSGAADISNWVIGSFDFRQNTGTSTTNVAAAVTTTSANNLALLLSSERTIATETSSQVTCTNFTGVFFENLSDQSLFIATKSMSSAGSTGSSTVTYPNTHNANGIAGILGIPPLASLSQLSWFQAISSIPTNLAQNMIGRYEFSGNTYDLSGAMNTATNQGGATLDTGRKGLVNNAYTFSGGAGSYMTTSNSFATPLDYSISVWFKTTTVSGGVLVGFSNSQTSLTPTNYDRMLWMNTSGYMNFGVYTGSISYITSTATYNDGAWHLATVTMSSTLGMTLYVDVSTVATSTNTVSQSYTGWWRFGQDNTTGWPTGIGQYFAGTLDDIFLYNIALTSTQVAALYAL